MGDSTVLFVGTYRAALLDYLAGNGEAGLALAYELGRQRINEDCTLLQLLCVHQKAVTTILESAPSADERLKGMNASGDFLMEVLSVFDIASRGYLALLQTHHPEPR